jgi:cob(I)alamin adenosyltransferase
MGDAGLTYLLFQRKVGKDSPEMYAIGDLDELCSFLGLVKTKLREQKKKDIIERMQGAIYTIASEIALGPEKIKKDGLLLNEKDTDWIKSIVYELEGKTDIKTHFYLPGDDELSAVIDIARTVARRAERSIVALFRKKKMENRSVLLYLNCISDVLFIMARRKTKTRKRA